MIRVLSYRFSAMGDVALCLPVLKSALELNPNLEITFVTREEFAFFFREVPRLKVIGVNFKNEYKGLFGLYRLAKYLKSLQNFNYVCDLHQVMRTQILNLFFINLQTFKIDKARIEKAKFFKNPNGNVLKHSTIRYLDVFRKIGLQLPNTVEELLSYGYEVDDSNEKTNQLLKDLEGHILIGIAPFARHFTKTWPFEYLQELVIKLEALNVKILLFGGPADQAKLMQLEKLNPHVICLAGVYSLEEELALMKKLKLIITMDSANMHFAALCKTPIISLWGGTHPGLGFFPMDPKAIILQIELSLLDCRPCSRFGLAACPKAHFECMNRLKPDMLLAEIKKSL